MELAYGEVDTMAQQELTSGTLACNDSLSQISFDEDDSGNIWLYLQLPGKPRVRLIFGSASMSKAIYANGQWSVQWIANGAK